MQLGFQESGHLHKLSDTRVDESHIGCGAHQGFLCQRNHVCIDSHLLAISISCRLGIKVLSYLDVVAFCQTARCK